MDVDSVWTPLVRSYGTRKDGRTVRGATGVVRVANRQRAREEKRREQRWECHLPKGLHMAWYRTIVRPPGAGGSVCVWATERMGGGDKAVRSSLLLLILNTSFYVFGWSFGCMTGVSETLVTLCCGMTVMLQLRESITRGFSHNLATPTLQIKLNTCTFSWYVNYTSSALVWYPQ